MLYARLVMFPMPLSMPLRTFLSQTAAHAVQVSSVRCASHLMKKNKRIVVSNVSKSGKRVLDIEKQVKKLQKKDQVLKPVEEKEGTPALRRSQEERLREGPEISYDESERRALLKKEWCRYKGAEARALDSAVLIAFSEQEFALEQLRAVSEDLYQAAIQIEPALSSVEIKGPLYTLPKKEYVPPEGDYADTTKYFNEY